MRADRIWYLILNSNRARILRGLPAEHEPDEAELSLQSRHHHLRDHLQDRPTRTFSIGSSGRRSGVEPASDPVREDALRFMREVKEFLTEQKAHAFDGLVVVAPPETLGLWRDGLGEPLSSAIRAEVPKNLMRQSAHELVETLRDLRDAI